jgi:hypothetical protein
MFDLPQLAIILGIVFGHSVLMDQIRTDDPYRPDHGMIGGKDSGTH